METMHADKAWGELRSAVTRCRAGESWQVLSDELGGGLEDAIATARRSSGDQVVLTYIHKALGYLPVMRWGAPRTAMVHEQTIHGLNTAIGGFITGKTLVCHIEPSSAQRLIAGHNTHLRLIEVFKHLGASRWACDDLEGGIRNGFRERLGFRERRRAECIEAVRRDMVPELSNLVQLLDCHAPSLSDADGLLPKDHKLQYFTTGQATFHMQGVGDVTYPAPIKIRAIADLREDIARIIHEECVKVIAPSLQWAYDLAPAVPHPHLEGVGP